MTSEKLYTALLTIEDYSLIISDEENYDKAIEMLSETDWSTPLKEIGVNKDLMYSFFGLKTQKALAAETGPKNDVEMIQT